MCDRQRLRSASSYAQSDQSLCLSFEYSLSVKLLAEYHLGSLSLKETPQDPLSLHLSKSHIVGAQMYNQVADEQTVDRLFVHVVELIKFCTIAWINKPWPSNT